MSYAQKKKAMKQVDPLIVLTSVYKYTHKHSSNYNCCRSDSAACEKYTKPFILKITHLME